MSIIGKGQELFIGKTKITIVDWMYNKTIINYSEISRIEYCNAYGIEGGFFDIIRFTGKKSRFCYNYKSNDVIMRAVNYISEHAPDIAIEKKDPNNYPYYCHKWFIFLIMLFCCWPIGFVLLWTSPLQNLRFKLIITFIFISSNVIVFAYSWYTMNALFRYFSSFLM